MKKWLIGFQLVFSAFFLFALIASFFITDTIKYEAQTDITDALVSRILPKVSATESLLNSRVVQRYVPDKDRTLLINEMDKFKHQPHEYVHSFVLGQAALIPPQLHSHNPLKNALITKLYDWKQSLKSYFDTTLKQLVSDIRIFMFSNMLAMLVAALVALKRKKLGEHAFAVSAMLTAVVVIASLTYLNQDWFFTILLNHYMKFGYLAAILLTTAWLFFEYYIHHDFTGHRPAKQKQIIG